MPGFLPAPHLAQEESQHFFFYQTVFLVADREIHPGFFVYDASYMAEAMEVFFSMITAHSAFTDSSPKGISLEAKCP